MGDRKRANKGHYRKMLDRKRAENEARISSKKNLERNGPANTSLEFNLKNSLPYYPHLTLFESGIYFEKAIKVFTEWENKNNWRTRGREQRKIHFFCLIANLVSLPRTNSGGSVRQPVSLTVTENNFLYDTVRFLRDNKFINILPGYSFPSTTSSDQEFDTSKIWPTIYFDDIFPPIKNYYEINLYVTFPDTEVVRIKQDEKRIELTNTDRKRTQGLSNKIIKINRVNLSHKIVTRISGREDPCCTKLSAVFSNNINRGGRLYTSGNSYQNDLKKNRALIYIDDEPTIELDYSGLHPRMLYAEKGIQSEGDVYDLSEILPEYRQDKALRALSKLVLLILINSQDHKNIPGTITKDLIENNLPLLNHLSSNYATRSTGNRKGIYRRIVEAVVSKHSDIATYFHSDAGARLQKKDGNMAARICHTFARQGKPILPEHDSFIVQAQYEDLLRRTMAQEYKNTNNGFTCPIEKV
jgi:hypothetical protein